MPQDQRLSLSRISGAAASVGDTLVWDGYRWKPGGGGGGVTGYATATAIWNSSVPQSSATVPDEIDLYTVGNHGLATDGVSTITYAEGVYLVQVSSSPVFVNSGSATDLVHVTYTAAQFPGVTFTTGQPLPDIVQASYNVVVGSNLENVSALFEPAGVTGRSYDLGSIYIDVIRFDLPA